MTQSGTDSDVVSDCVGTLRMLQMAGAAAPGSIKYLTTRPAEQLIWGGDPGSQRHQECLALQAEDTRERGLHPILSGFAVSQMVVRVSDGAQN